MRKILESLKEKIDLQQPITILTKSRNYSEVQMVHVADDIIVACCKGKALILKPDCIFGYKMEAAVQPVSQETEVSDTCEVSKTEVPDTPVSPEKDTKPLLAFLPLGLDSSSPIVDILKEIESDRLLQQDLETMVEAGWEDDFKNEAAVPYHDKFLTLANQIKALPKGEDTAGLFDEIHRLIRQDKSCEVSLNLLLAILYDRSNQPYQAFRLLHESVQDCAAVKMAHKFIPEDDFFDYVGMRICFNEGIISKKEMPLLFYYTKMCAARKDGSILFARLSSALDVYPNLPAYEKNVIQGVLLYLAMNSGVAVTANELTDAEGIIERLKREWPRLESCTLDRQDEIAQNINQYMIEETLENDEPLSKPVDAAAMDGIGSEIVGDVPADGSSGPSPAPTIEEGATEKMESVSFDDVMPAHPMPEEKMSEKNYVGLNVFLPETDFLNSGEKTTEEEADDSMEAFIRAAEAACISGNVESISRLLDGIGDAEDVIPEEIRTNTTWIRKMEEYRALVNANSVAEIEAKVGELCGFLYVSRHQDLEDVLRLAWSKKREEMLRMEGAASSEQQMEAME